VYRHYWLLCSSGTSRYSSRTIGDADDERCNQPGGEASPVQRALGTAHRGTAQRLRHHGGQVQGEFVWHSHADTDDFFLVLKGRLTIRLRDREVELYRGELFVVPCGVEHQPFAEEETHLLLIEPSGTSNTGDAATAAPRRTI